MRTTRRTTAKSRSARVDGMRIVTNGLKAGERIVVNGLQRVRPGALVAPQMVAMDARAAAQTHAATGCTIEQSTVDAALMSQSAPEGSVAMNFSNFFIDRPIFAGVLSVLIFVAGPARAARDADLGISRGRAAVGRRARATIPGANPKVIAETVATPIEEADQRRRGHALHVQPGDDRRR